MLWLIVIVYGMFRLKQYRESSQEQTIVRYDDIPKLRRNLNRTLKFKEVHERPLITAPQLPMQHDPDDTQNNDVGIETYYIQPSQHEMHPVIHRKDGTLEHKHVDESDDLQHRFDSKSDSIAGDGQGEDERRHMKIESVFTSEPIIPIEKEFNTERRDSIISVNSDSHKTLRPIHPAQGNIGGHENQIKAGGNFPLTDDETAPLEVQDTLIDREERPHGVPEVLSQNTGVVIIPEKSDDETLLDNNQEHTKAVCPVATIPQKQFCVTLDVRQSDATEYDVKSLPLLPFSEHMYVIKDLTDINISYNLPHGASVYAHRALITRVGEAKQRYLEAVFVTTNASQSVQKTLQMRERAVFLLNRILELNLVSQSFLTGDALPWTESFLQQTNPQFVRTTVHVSDKPAHTDVGGYSSFLLLLYLANCAVPVDAYHQESFTQSGYVMDYYSCFSTGADTGLLAEHHLLEMKNFLFGKYVCQIPRQLIYILQMSDDVTTTLETIGMQLVEAFESVHLPNATHYATIIAESLDGRVSEVLHWYRNQCVDEFEELVLNEESRLVMHTTTITGITVINRNKRTKVVLRANFKNGASAYFKLVHLCSSDLYGEGARELLAFYVDRVIGLNRYPNIVIRRFYIKDTYPYGIYQHHVLIPLNISQTVFRSHFEKYVNPSAGGRKYIIFLFKGTIKHAKRFVGNPEEIVSALFPEIYPSPSIDRSVTRQTLRDITSIIIFDFIIHNWNRMSSNWIKSSLRVSPYDAENAWYNITTTGSPVCERMIQYPALPGSGKIMARLINRNIPSLNRNVPESCKQVPNNYRLCHFDKDMVDKVKYHGKEMVERINIILENEDHSHITCMRAGRHGIFSGIEQRISYLQKYFDSCFRKFGHHMYI